MELLNYDVLPNNIKKSEKKKAIDYIISSHKAMGIYDSQTSETVLMSYVNEHLEKQRYIKEYNVYFNVIITKL